MKRKLKDLWLSVKRYIRIGRYISIFGDKCNRHWTDEECPNEAKVARYHIGQFGHRIIFVWCNDCYSKSIKWVSEQPFDPGYISGTDFCTVPDKFKTSDKVPESGRILDFQRD